MSIRMAPRLYRIGELSKKLNVESFVIRFWEKELNIKPERSPGGQRFYKESDFETFKTIKTLLYDYKFTLAGAKQKLQEIKKGNKVILTTKAPEKKPHKKLKQELYLIKKKLEELKSLF